MEAGSRDASGIKTGKAGYMCVPLGIPVPLPNNAGNKLWKDFNLHNIREACRSIRVRTGEIEVYMTTMSKVKEARIAFTLVSNLVEELRIELEGKKRR